MPQTGTWDGLDKAGDELPTGMYYWKVTAIADGVTETKVGKLVIVR